MIRSAAALFLAASLLGGCRESTPSAPAAAPALAAVPAAPAAVSVVPARPAAPSETIFMQAVFGAAYRAAGNFAYAELPDPEQPGTRSFYVIKPVQHSLLKNGDAVLVGNGENGSEDGSTDSGHGNGGLLNVFILRQTGGQWKVLRRHENIATLGSHGQLGDVAWPELAAGKPGLAVISGGTWQGYTVASLSLFDLGAERMQELANIRLHSDSLGACDPETERKCWEVDGEWRFDPSARGARFDDLVITFRGQETVGKAKPTPIEGSARYAFDGRRYVLAEGENLVPQP